MTFEITSVGGSGDIWGRHRSPALLFVADRDARVSLSPSVRWSGASTTPAMWIHMCERRRPMRRVSPAAQEARGAVLGGSRSTVVASSNVSPRAETRWKSPCNSAGRGRGR